MTLPASLLIVDDDRELGQMLTEYLTGEGFQVTLLRDGAEARRSGRERGRRTPNPTRSLSTRTTRLSGLRASLQSQLPRYVP